MSLGSIRYVGPVLKIPYVANSAVWLACSHRKQAQNGSCAFCLQAQAEPAKAQELGPLRQPMLEQALGHAAVAHLEEIPRQKLASIEERAETWFIPTVNLQGQPLSAERSTRFYASMENDPEKQIEEFHQQFSELMTAIKERFFCEPVVDFIITAVAPENR